MIAAVTSALSSMIGWIGSFVTSLVDSEGALYVLLPLFAIGIAASLCMFAMKIIMDSQGYLGFLIVEMISKAALIYDGISAAFPCKNGGIYD